MCPVPIDHDDYVWLTSQVASFSEDRGVDIPRSFRKLPQIEDSLN